MCGCVGVLTRWCVGVSVCRSCGVLIYWLGGVCCCTLMGVGLCCCVLAWIDLCLCLLGVFVCVDVLMCWCVNVCVLI